MKALTRIFAPLCLTALAGCWMEAPKDEAITEQMLESLHNRPVGSYALVPTNKMGEPVGTDGKTSGYHALVLKIGELKSNHGLTENGQSVQRTCSTFKLVTTELNDKGEVTAHYFDIAPLSNYTTTRVIDLSGDTVTVPEEVAEDKRGFRLESARTKSYCTNVPASP